MDVDATRIHVTKLSNDRHHRSSFGFCTDIGAPKSVIGRKELNRIFAEQNMRPSSLSKSPFKNPFRFAGNTFESLVQNSIQLKTPFGVAPVYVQLDVFQADIPALLGMDVLDRESLMADTVANRLIKRTRLKHKDDTIGFIDE